jgi:hypothetical protein
MSKQPRPDEVTEAQPAPELVDFYTGRTNARWVVVGFVALIAAFVLYIALGMPGMSHDGGGGMDHDMDNMRSGEMLP